MNLTIEQESRAGLAHLQNVYPGLRSLFELIGDLQYPSDPGYPLLDAVARVINSQMLSTHAASAIMQRLLVAVEDRSVRFIVDLPEAVLRECGMSRSKIKSLMLFRTAYNENSEFYENWRTLDFTELEKSVRSCWGMGTWTAEMLAIFYFNQRDVFPKFDLAINRAVDKIKSHLDEFEVNLASPHRTLLAIYMWASYRTDYWNSLKASTIGTASAGAKGSV